MPSVQMRPSISPQVNDLKQRVIACLNRLADRDTLSLAAAELHSIALNLSPETLAVFINCLLSTDSSSKPPVRKHCVSLLSVLSRYHEDWRARKAAAETMTRVAVAEQELAPLYKKNCLPILERRRFDKVKLVRETMIHTFSLWKQLDVDSTESISSPSKSAYSGKRNNKLRHFKESLSSKLNDVEKKDSKEVAYSKEKRNQAKLSNKLKENGFNNKLQAFQSKASSASKTSNAEEKLSLIRNQITRIEKQQISWRTRRMECNLWRDEYVV